MSEQKKFTYEEILDTHGKLIYKNVGTSMMPLLRQNHDLMIIEKRPQGRLKKYDAVLYKSVGGRYILHRILKVGKEDYIICGDHCIHREFGIKEEQILGVLTAVVRDGKTIEVTDKKYLFYVHLWCDFFYIRVAILFFKQFARRAGSFVVRKIFKNKKGMLI